MDLTQLMFVRAVKILGGRSKAGSKVTVPLQPGSVPSKVPMEMPGAFDGNAIHCTLASLRWLTWISCAFQVSMLMVNPDSSMSVAYIRRRECCSLKDQPMRPTKTLG